MEPPRGEGSARSYETFQVTGYGSKEPKELHAYTKEQWDKLGLFTRVIARISGSVTKETIGGQKYFVEKSLYTVGQKNSTRVGLSSDAVKAAIRQIKGGVQPNEIGKEIGVPTDVVKRSLTAEQLEKAKEIERTTGSTEFFKNFIKKFEYIDDIFGDENGRSIISTFPALVHVPIRSQNETLFHFVRTKEHVEFLYQLAPDQINVKDNNGLTPLHCACKDGDLEAAKALLEKGAAITAQTNDGNTALHLSIERDNNSRVMAVLLSANPDLLLIKNNKGNTPLHHILFQEEISPENFRCLLDIPLKEGASWSYKTLFEMKNKDNQTIQDLALDHWDIEEVMELINKGDAPNARFINQTTLQINREGWTKPSYTGNTSQERLHDAFESLKENKVYKEYTENSVLNVGKAIMAKQIVQEIFQTSDSSTINSQARKLQLNYHPDKINHLPPDEQQQRRELGIFLQDLLEAKHLLDSG